MKSIIFNFEIRRKTFHLYGFIVPLFYFFVSKLVMTSLLFLALIIILPLDMSRHFNFGVRELVNKFVGKIIRPEEANGSFQLSGVSYMMAGFFLTALFFSKGLAITSWLIVIISDCLAALIGIKIGTPLENGKSLEGSVAFLSSAFFISILVYFFVGYNTTFLVIIISSIITTITEFYSKEFSIDDNLSIPVIYCFSTVIFNFVLGS